MIGFSITHTEIFVDGVCSNVFSAEQNSAGPLELIEIFHRIALSSPTKSIGNFLLSNDYSSL